MCIRDSQKASTKESEQALTKHLLKLSEIEMQFQELTNKFEEVNFKLDKLSSRVTKIQSDNQLRFSDLENGCFCMSSPSQYVIGGDLVIALKKLLGTNFVELERITISNTLRSKVLSILIDYFNIHLQGFGKIKSVNILHEIFR